MAKTQRELVFAFLLLQERGIQPSSLRASVFFYDSCFPNEQSDVAVVKKVDKTLAYCLARACPHSCGVLANVDVRNGD